MAELKLGKLPDRTPIKLTITITPHLHRSLQAYAAAYEQAYGVSEPLTTLIPAILTAFLDGDRAFAKERSALPKSARDND